nr:immunoglobulin heavy chain junction region [Macaca mulatta]
CARGYSNHQDSGYSFFDFW